MKTISLDFDGVIHSFTSPWTTEYEIHDPPTPGAIDFIREAMRAGWEVHILSARVSGPLVERAILTYLTEHGLELEYTNRVIVSAVKRGAIVYIDDRGFRFDGTWPTLEAIEAMVPWNKVAK